MSINLTTTPDVYKFEKQYRKKENYYGENEYNKQHNFGL